MGFNMSNHRKHLKGGVMSATTRNPCKCAVMLTLLLSMVLPTLAREQSGTLTPSDWPSGGGGFGGSVAVHGDYIVVGASRDAERAPDAGAVYVFHWTEDAWVEEAKLTASDAAPSDWFGYSVSMDNVAGDDLIIVGAPSDWFVFSDVGKAYVFRRDGTNWIEEAKLVSSGSTNLDIFGGSVSASGDRAVISASGEAPAGKAYVFRRSGTTWTEEAVLTAGDPDPAAVFAGSVSISGTRIVVGAPSDSEVGDRTGAAYVFRHDGVGWAQEAKLFSANPVSHGQFGFTVSISGDALVIGPQVSVFHRLVGGWTHVARLHPTDGPSGNSFGDAVAIDGETIVVGAPDDDEAGNDAGAGYLYKQIGSEWVGLDKLLPADPGVIDDAGFSVSVHAKRAVLGAPGRAAYVYEAPEEIPAVSAWGLVAMVLSLLSVASIRLRRAVPCRILRQGAGGLKQFLIVTVTVSCLSSSGAA